MHLALSSTIPETIDCVEPIFVHSACPSTFPFFSFSVLSFFNVEHILSERGEKRAAAVIQGNASVTLSAVRKPASQQVKGNVKKKPPEGHQCIITAGAE